MTPPDPAHRGHDDPLRHDQRRARRPVGASTPLHRSRSRVLGGVCAGIASFIGARASVVRTIWLVSLIPSLGMTALAYPAMWLLLPLEPAPEASGATRQAPTSAGT
jgi:phage shock protein PspC (stress-responsive transcriptional regulator)